MNDLEKIKEIRGKTMSPMNKISEAFKQANGDVHKAIEILIAQKQADASDMAKRVADASIVYSYVHNGKIGAMISLACQTDFVSRNDLFLGLAKNICMHIVSTPIPPIYVSETEIPGTVKSIMESDFRKEIVNKPEQVVIKIITGKMNKFVNDFCLLKQKFVKDDSKTIEQLINEVAVTLGEKIEIKAFSRMKA